MKTFSHSVVICTRSRKESLIECLDSLASNKAASHVQIIIVLNGISEEDYRELESSLRSQFDFNLIVLRSEPGLTNARNMALSHNNSDLITFLDDDVLLPVDFISKTEEFFRVNGDIHGASPRIKGLYINKDKNIRMLVRRNYGRLTKTCRNYWVPDLDVSTITKIDWLPGCCMTYRMAEVGLNQFSIELENGPTGGYALGEDVDFSIRIGRLGLIKNLCIEHRQAPSVRDSSRVMSRAIGRWHGYLIRTYPEKVSRTRTIALDALLLGYLVFKLFLFRKSAKREFVNKVIEFNSLISELCNPILVSKK